VLDRLRPRGEAVAVGNAGRSSAGVVPSGRGK